MMLASWRSGDAADCKSVYAGSIPAEASTTFLLPIDLFGHSLPQGMMRVRTFSGFLFNQQQLMQYGDALSFIAPTLLDLAIMLALETSSSYSV